MTARWPPRLGVRAPLRAAAATLPRAADGLVDADRLPGTEALLVPLARPAALAELPRLAAARRMALIADRACCGWSARRPSRS